MAKKKHKKKKQEFPRLSPAQKEAQEKSLQGAIPKVEKAVEQAKDIAALRAEVQRELNPDAPVKSDLEVLAEINPEAAAKKALELAQKGQTPILAHPTTPDAPEPKIMEPLTLEAEVIPTEQEVTPLTSPQSPSLEDQQAALSLEDSPTIEDEDEFDWLDCPISEQDCGQMTGRQLSEAIREYAAYDGAVNLVLKAVVEKVPEVFPNYHNWKVKDVNYIIHNRMQMPGWVETLVPPLYMMLGDNLTNTRWAAQVAIHMTAVVIAMELPLLIAQQQMVQEQANQPRIIVPEKQEIIV
jgi:hypothetical protein